MLLTLLDADHWRDPFHQERISPMFPKIVSASTLSSEGSGFASNSTPYVPKVYQHRFQITAHSPALSYRYFSSFFFSCNADPNKKAKLPLKAHLQKKKVVQMDILGYSYVLGSRFVIVIFACCSCTYANDGE